MANKAKEISAGAQFSRSMEEGVVADSLTRVFKVLTDSPGAEFDIQKTCEVYIGDKHPKNTNVYCSGFDAHYDGDSRTVAICVFQYKSAPSATGKDPQEQNPKQRPANWSVSSVVHEEVAYLWNAIDGPAKSDGWVVPTNPAGDRYDGVTRMQPLVTFSVEQYESTDPSKHALLAGVVNKTEYKIGTYSAPERTLMFRGIQAQPVVEYWGKDIYRGWKATYEFVYRSNYAGPMLGKIGWDIALPQTGFNIINKESALGGGSNEVGSLALAHGTDGKITDWPSDPSLVAGTDGKKVRGMVLVHSYSDGGASQVPCAQPIPLNDDGTPRSHSATPPVKVYRYQVQEAYNFDSFGLRYS